MRCRLRTAHAQRLDRLTADFERGVALLFVRQRAAQRSGVRRRCVAADAAVRSVRASLAGKPTRLHGHWDTGKTCLAMNGLQHTGNHTWMNIQQATLASQLTHTTPAHARTHITTCYSFN